MTLTQPTQSIKYCFFVSIAMLSVAFLIFVLVAVSTEFNLPHKQASLFWRHTSDEEYEVYNMECWFEVLRRNLFLPFVRDLTPIPNINLMPLDLKTSGTGPVS